MLKINSSMIRKRSSKLIFTFSKERIESTESLSKMNKITEEDIIGNSSADSDEEIYIKDNHGLNMKNEYLIRTPGKKESVKFQRKENKSHTIKAFDESKKKADNKNKKKENIENVAFTITKNEIKTFKSTKEVGQIFVDYKTFIKGKPYSELSKEYKQGIDIGEGGFGKVKTIIHKKRGVLMVIF